MRRKYFIGQKIEAPGGYLELIEFIDEFNKKKNRGVWNRNAIIKRIKRGKQGKDLLLPSKKRKLSDEQVLEIINLFDDGLTLTAISKKLNIRHAILTDVIRRRGAYKNG